MTERKKGFFYKPVDKRSRQAMTDFLNSHFRYYTMNSWNLSTSYANKVKLHNLELEKEGVNLDHAFKILDQGNAIQRINSLMYGWEKEQKQQWLVGFNGRSEGYIVLYEGDGKGGIYPGRSIDQDADFEDMTFDELRWRTELVQDFDKLCDQIRDLFIFYCKNYCVTEEEILVEKTIKVLKPIGECT